MTIASRIARHVGIAIIVLGCAVDRFVASIEPHPAAGVLPIEGPGSAMRERLRARWNVVEWRGAEAR